MASKDVALVHELPTYVRGYSDCTVERLAETPLVSPSADVPDPQFNVLSKDITISQSPKVSARLYLPNPIPDSSPKLPILVYFHGGAFYFESSFSSLNQGYLNRLVALSKVVAVSVEYRLGPEHPLPAAYDDCWAALQWTVSHSSPPHGNTSTDTWLTNHAYFNRLYIGGDSAGGNIAHNITMRAGAESLHGDVKILGTFLGHPYFWGSDPVGKEITRANDREESIAAQVWKFVYPSAPGGIDNPMINPAGNRAPSLAGLGCKRLLVCVARKDALRERGVWYGQLVRESGWRGELEEVFEVEGEDQVFHALHPETENAMKMLRRLASFLK